MMVSKTTTWLICFASLSWALYLFFPSVEAGMEAARSGEVLIVTSGFMDAFFCLSWALASMTLLPVALSDRTPQSLARIAALMAATFALIFTIIVSMWPIQSAAMAWVDPSWSHCKKISSGNGKGFKQVFTRSDAACQTLNDRHTSHLARAEVLEFIETLNDREWNDASIRDPE